MQTIRRAYLAQQLDVPRLAPGVSGFGHPHWSMARARRQNDAPRTVEIEEIPSIRRFARLEAALRVSRMASSPSAETGQMSAITPRRVDAK